MEFSSSTGWSVGKEEAVSSRLQLSGLTIYRSRTQLLGALLLVHSIEELSGIGTQLEQDRSELSGGQDTRQRTRSAPQRSRRSARFRG